MAQQGRRDQAHRRMTKDSDVAFETFGAVANNERRRRRRATLGIVGIIALVAIGWFSWDPLSYALGVICVVVFGALMALLDDEP